MAIELVRIDDRLIHGQVATAWIGNCKIEQVLIINDSVKNDEMQRDIIAMTAPPNVIVRVFGVDEFIGIANRQPINKRTMLILTSPKDVYALVAGGVEIDFVNVGGMRFGGDRKMLTKAVFTTPEDEEFLKKLIQGGVELEIRLLPKTEGIWVKDILK